MKTLSNDELRKVQLLELKVLKEIKRICEKHNIKYFLTGGTLIGAIRHKGFIPWDDDIDIAMERSEYDKFMEIAPTELSDEYTLVNMKTNESLGIFLGRLVLNGTNYRTVQQPKTLENTGFWVDILPYDYIYDNKFLAALYYWKLNFFVVLYSMKNGYHNGTTKLKRFIAEAMKICFFFIPKKYLRKRILNYPYRLNKKKSNTQCFLTGRYGVFRELRSGYLFGDYTQMPFEDDQFMVLTKSHEFLTELFGDYMTLPPESERVTHQIAELDFGKY